MKRPTPPETRSQWQIDQAATCSCRGGNDLCPCQNVSPDDRAAMIARNSAPFWVTEEQLEAAARAHDAEDAAYRGEPSPWSIDGDDEQNARFRSDRLSALRVGFEAAGVKVEPTGIDYACRAMGIQVDGEHHQAIYSALRHIRSLNQVSNTAFLILMQYFPPALRIAAKALQVSPKEARILIADGAVRAEPFLTRFDAACRAEFKP